MSTQNGYFQHSRPEMLKYIPNGTKTLLDVGCGEARFADLVKRTLGCNVWGVEPDALAAAVGRSRVDVMLNAQFDRSLDLRKQTFDCIVFNDVLEHLVHPADALVLARANLAAGGVVVASIPNVRFFLVILEVLVTKDWRYREAGVLDRTHLRFFTKKSIERLFSESGFAIQLIEGLTPTFDWRFRLLNLLTLGRMGDMRYPQFAVVAAVR